MKALLEFFLILLILSKIEAKKKSRSVSFLDSNYTLNGKYFKQLQINISDDRSNVDMLAESVQDITEVWATLGVTAWEKSSKSFRSAISYDIDLRDTLAKIKSSNIPLLSAWLSNVLKYGNLSSTCPFPKNLYYFSKLKPEKDSIPPFAPSGKFRTSVQFYKKMSDDSKEVMAYTEMTFVLK